MEGTPRRNNESADDRQPEAADFKNKKDKKSKKRSVDASFVHFDRLDTDSAKNKSDQRRQAREGFVGKASLSAAFGMEKNKSGEKPAKKDQPEQLTKTDSEQLVGEPDVTETKAEAKSATGEIDNSSETEDISLDKSELTIDHQAHAAEQQEFDEAEPDYDNEADDFEQENRTEPGVEIELDEDPADEVEGATLGGEEAAAKQVEAADDLAEPSSETFESTDLTDEAGFEAVTESEVDAEADADAEEYQPDVQDASSSSATSPTSQPSSSGLNNSGGFRGTGPANVSGNSLPPTPPLASAAPGPAKANLAPAKAETTVIEKHNNFWTGVVAGGLYEHFKHKRREKKFKKHSEIQENSLTELKGERVANDNKLAELKNNQAKAELDKKWHERQASHSNEQANQSVKESAASPKVESSTRTGAETQPKPGLAPETPTAKPAESGARANYERASGLAVEHIAPSQPEAASGSKRQEAIKSAAEPLLTKADKLAEKLVDKSEQPLPGVDYLPNQPFENYDQPEKNAKESIDNARQQNIKHEKSPNLDMSDDEPASAMEGRRVEQSAWHRIEIDKATGKVVENPSLAYGEAFQRERHQETKAQDSGGQTGSTSPFTPTSPMANQDDGNDSDDDNESVAARPAPAAARQNMLEKTQRLSTKQSQNAQLGIWTVMALVVIIIIYIAIS